MCYAVLLPSSVETPTLPEMQPYIPSEPVADPVAEPDTKLSDLPALAVMLEKPTDIGEPAFDNSIDKSSAQVADILPTSPVDMDLPDPCQPDIPPTDVVQPIQEASVPLSLRLPPIEEILPEFLKYKSVMKHRLYRKKSRARLRGILRRITCWLLALFVVVLAYTAWLHNPMIASDQQTATSTAARLALAINDRDYELLYNSTIWTDHYRQAFHSSSDIDRFCRNQNKAQSFKLHHLAELWQMKHTVVVSGKLIGLNSIGYTFIDTSSKQQKFQFTLTRTPSKRWMWDIAYDYRLAPSDIPLLNHIMVQSRLQEAK